jgi:cytidylate kinase
VVVAIDGPGGVGKSTVASRVADALGVPHLDTGAIYRTATLAALRARVAIGDVTAIVAVLETAEIGYEAGRATLDGRDVTEAIRSPEVTAAVSPVAAIPEVRELAVSIQRSWVVERGGSAVVEGRDIGTVVFPKAAVKVFLTATPEIRAQRRAGDSEAGGSAVGEVATELARRDRLDSTRAASPLKPAPDAAIIDTSELGIDEVVAEVLALTEDASAG